MRSEDSNEKSIHPGDTWYTDLIKMCGRMANIIYVYMGLPPLHRYAYSINIYALYLYIKDIDTRHVWEFEFVQDGLHDDDNPDSVTINGNAMSRNYMILSWNFIIVDVLRIIAERCCLTLVLIWVCSKTNIWSFIECSDMEKSVSYYGF